MPKPVKDPCKSFACRIQACLSENHYQENKCLHVLEDMRQCCLKWHKESLCCSGIILDKPYIIPNGENQKRAEISSSNK